MCFWDVDALELVRCGSGVIRLYISSNCGQEHRGVDIVVVLGHTKTTPISEH